MKLLAVFLLVFSVVIQTSSNPYFGWTQTICPTDWTPINNRCFLYVTDYNTWADAEKTCQSLEANLASVHNSDEYRQVQNLIAAAGHRSKQAWIGGYDAQQEKTWFWSDGSPMTYTNWCPWQPDNILGSQHCLQMNYSDQKCWDDLRCDYLQPYVCAKKPSAN